MEALPLLHLNLLMKRCNLWLLFIISVICFSSYYGSCEYFSCGGDFNCGGHILDHPFGKRNSGCGDPMLQLQCHNNMPLLDINGTQYYILYMNTSIWDISPYSYYNPGVGFHYGYDYSEGVVMKIINTNLMDKECDLSSSNSSTQFWSSDQFHIVDGYKNITLWEGCQDAPQSALVSGCNGRFFYNTSSDMTWTGKCKSQVQLPVPQYVDPGPNLLQNIKQGFEIKCMPSSSCQHCLSKGRCAYKANVTSNPFVCMLTDPEEEKCQACERGNGYCWYNSSLDVACFCMDGTESDQCPSAEGKRRIQVIVGVSAGIGIMLIVPALLLVAACIMYIGKFFQKKACSSASKVEKFLQDFTHEMPTRYSYSQLKKITNNFADKLGEGGFGIVYKGKLSMGNLVAVKILDQSRQSESQFMNEVATIGRIRHVHLVRLMGYCFEGSRSALVYEYMANGSLEKFVFGKKEKEQILSWEQLHSIALGAARGIAFLHQDCEKRIIHFDIKPHNILLDADFTPKVSDFGLAKLCGRLDDHISVTVARGTLGYMAPELNSRHLGPITEKADVYSFGMLLLEIAGRRKNIDVQVNRSSELYLPDWAFKHLEKGELEQVLRGRIGGEIGCENDREVMRMCKVGLWCIQYKSMDRPTMSRVVQMLEGNGDEVSNPPSPFNSAASPELRLLSSSEESSSM